jgi:hypothetical protein
VTIELLQDNTTVVGVRHLQRCRSVDDTTSTSPRNLQLTARARRGGQCQPAVGRAYRHHPGFAHAAQHAAPCPGHTAHSTDNLTNVKTPTFHGTGPKNALIELLINGNAGTGNADSNGN